MKYLIKQSDWNFCTFYNIVQAKSTGIEFACCLCYQVQLSSQLNELCKAGYANQRTRIDPKLFHLGNFHGFSCSTHLHSFYSRLELQQRIRIALSHLAINHHFCCFLHFKCLFVYVQECMYLLMCVHICQERPEVSTGCGPSSITFHFLRHIS